MYQQARQLINDYLREHPEGLLAALDREGLERQRQCFLDTFGPAVLADLDDAGLASRLPHGPDNRDSLDYWLEYRIGADFDTRCFGSIAGGSAAKFGLWRDQDGRWRAKRPGERAGSEIDAAEALVRLRERRRELLAAVAALEHLVGRGTGEPDPEAVQRAVAAAAPHWGSSAWLHKYLHLVLPERVTGLHTLAWLRAGLYRLGQPAKGSGPYALDTRLLCFWGRLPAVAGLPLVLRYRLPGWLTPRDHWVLRLPGGDCRNLLADDCLALGPEQLDSLAGAFSLSRRRELRRAVESALLDAGLDKDPSRVANLLALGRGLSEGAVVALLDESDRLAALGEVRGPYRHAPGRARPHQVPVRWQLRTPLPLPVLAPGEAESLTLLDPAAPLSAWLEAALLVQGAGPWPNFQGQPIQHSRVGEPPAAAGLCGELLTTLARKPQLILYGPPGTGKTWQAQRLALEVVARHNYRCLPEQLSERQLDAIHGRDGGEPVIVTCAFHPGMGYEDFIEGFRPVAGGFELRPGLFLSLSRRAAARPGETFVLVIDEFNRANLPRVLGELLTLLEPGQRGRLAVVLPLSRERLAVPDNLYLIATMNTADRSILLLDTALRRRFAFRELLPQPTLLADVRLGELSLADWLAALNRRIIARLGRDARNLQVGHAFFMADGRPIQDAEGIAAVLQDEIWPLLQEYCYEDPDALTGILGGLVNGAGELRRELFEPARRAELTAALSLLLEPLET